ncbi:hypothetical protein MOUN0_M06502 [Monosporozyma unispora]|nr:Altered inheritance of mitochondria protein 23, mitochondrial [Kazachstania unispora]
MNTFLLKKTIGNTYIIRTFHSFNCYLTGYDVLQSIRSDIYKGNPKLSPIHKKNKPRLNDNSKKPFDNKKQFNKPRSKRLMVKWTTGSERARLAANQIIKEVYDLNKDGTIKMVDQETNQVQTSDIRNFIKGLNLEEEGLSIVNVEKNDVNKYKVVQIPLLKRVDAKTALKRYTDLLVKEKEKELAELGLLKKKNNSSKKDPTIKHIRITWQISEDDLNNQKANEINSLLQKGHKVNLYIESRSNNLPKSWLENFEELENNEAAKRLSKREIKDNNNLMENLKDIVEPYSITPVIEGSIYNKMIMKLAPRPDTKPNVDKKSLRDERKKERQLKLQRRIEKKQMKESEST